MPLKAWKQCILEVSGNILQQVSLTLEYYRRSARPGSNEVIHVKLRKRKSGCFELFSSFMFLYD